MEHKHEKVPSICRRLLFHNFILKVIIPVFIILISILWLIVRLRIDLPTFHSMKIRPLLLKVLAINYIPPILGLFIMGCLTFILTNHLLHPEKSKLGKSVLANVNEFENNYLSLLFDEIDQDINDYGKNFNGVFVGKDWIIGRCSKVNTVAIRKKNIRAIFNIRYNYFQKDYYYIYLIDQYDKKTEFNLFVSKELDAIYTYLCGEYPLAKQGGINDYSDFHSLSKEQREEFYDYYNRKLAQQEDEAQAKKLKTFLLNGSFLKPCSCSSFYKVEETLDMLIPNENFQLVPMTPIYHSGGLISTGISCTPDSNGLYDVRLLIDKTFTNIAYSKIHSKVQTRKILSDYFYYSQIPNTYNWTPIGPYTPKQDRENKPPVAFTVDIDELIK